MDIELARTFIEIVRCGSFVAAAERLHVTQTAITARVQNLETQLNSKLFVREAGKQLVWRYKATLADSNYVCSGLRLVDGEGLYRFSPKACSDAAVATWNSNEQQLLAGSAAFFTPLQKDGSAFAADEQELAAMTLAPGYVFSLKGQRQCLPYMQQDFSATPTAAVGQQLALERDDASSHLFMACLPNLAVTTS